MYLAFPMKVFYVKLRRCSLGGNDSSNSSSFIAAWPELLQFTTADALSRFVETCDLQVCEKSGPTARRMGRNAGEAMLEARPKCRAHNPRCSGMEAPSSRILFKVGSAEH